ncbi:MAG: LytTR family DNA-binding domain-containing protein [Chloroflexota bacterium]|nr:LytTR family DNA-binding domain-containing protein [Chloroflexota bacterium]
MKVSTLIVDDEPVARAGLHAMLRAIAWVEVVGEAADGIAAVEAINRLRPELVLLDVQMPGLLGTDVLRELTHQPYVVFTTAFAEHAVSAFELGALDYILKPFGPTRLAAAMERVRSVIGEPAAHPSLERLGAAFGQGPISRLFVRSGASLLPLSVDRVSWFAADGDYVVAHAERARHLLHLSLARLEARLDSKRFLRIHRTHIVNLDHVKTFKRGLRGQLVAEMTDGTRLSVSRARAQELRSQGV